MATSATAQFTQLPTKYYYPVSKCCTYPAFNPPVSSPPPVTTPQNPPPATVPLSSFCPATYFSYDPAPTYKAAMAKPKKKRKFFPTHRISPVTQPASTPTNLFQPAFMPVELDDPPKPANPVPAIQPDAPAFQPDVPTFQSDVPAFQSDVLMPAF